MAQKRKPGPPPPREAPLIQWDQLSVPTRWVNTVVGFFLIPVIWIAVASFVSLTLRTIASGGLWENESLSFFVVGFALWLGTFALRSQRLLFLYVTSHEFAHAIWVWILGGRVSHMELSPKGGEVHVSKTNFFIALAPYFFPIQTAALVLAWLPLGLVADLTRALPWFSFLLGITWSFHSSYTVMMLLREQTDLKEHGAFFSLCLILLMNLVFMNGLLVLITPGLTLQIMVEEWLQQGILIVEWLEKIVRWIPG